MITIGQSPRIDMVPEMRDIIGQDIDVLEIGALDGLSIDEVQSRFSPGKGDQILCTRMVDGTEVVIGKKPLLRAVQACIDSLNKKKVHLILLLCTGKFPVFPSATLLVEAQKIMDQFMLALCRKGDTIGLLLPLFDQCVQAMKQYRRIGAQLVPEAASPYATRDEVSRAARKLKAADPRVVFMHCMGYTQEMKEAVSRITEKPTVLARSIVARSVRELLI
jgi:protein AroM